MSFPRMSLHFSTRQLVLMWLVIDMSSALICGSVSPSQTWMKSIRSNCGMLLCVVPAPMMMAPQCVKATMMKEETLLDEDTDDSSALYAGTEFQNITVVPPSRKILLENNSASIPGGFVNKLRVAAPFLQAHRGKIFVIHISGKVAASPDFTPLLDDIALLFMMGVKVVLVLGCTHQEILMHRQRGIPYSVVDELPITTKESLSISMEAAGCIRFQVENRMSAGHLPGVSKVGVASGNYYMASPIGVRWGVDFMYSGTARRVEAEKIKRRVTEDIVQLSCIGYSSTGNAYRVRTEDLASVCAIQLGAAKLIYVTGGEQLVGYRKDGKSNKPVTIGSLSSSQAKYIAMDINARFVPLNDSGLQVTPRHLKGSKLHSYRREYGQALGYCVDATSNGVKRAHIVSANNGAILEELFTPDGSGLLVLKDIYSGIRKARESDLNGIMDIIDPLAQKGILKERSKAELEEDLKHLVVVVRDYKLVGCALLKMHGSKHGEISCLAIHPSFRHRGLGEALLGYLERQVFASDLEHCFILSTTTMTWFAERGYNEISPDELPSAQQHLYSWKRNPKVYRKSFMHRRTDTEELLWHP